MEESTASTTSFRVVYVLGPPGAGKGTLCSELQHHMDLIHLSVGDFLRGLCEDSADTAPLEAAQLSQIELKHILDERSNVPPVAIVAILRHTLSGLRNAGHKGVLLDGFPRDIMSAKLFEKEAPEYAPQLVLNFLCQRETAQKRFIERARSVDDTTQVFDKRYDKFIANNPAILQMYESVKRDIDTNSNDLDGNKARSLAAVNDFKSSR